MSTSLSLSDRLVVACANGDLPTAKALIADGASVNDEGEDADGSAWVPLVAAVRSLQYDLVVMLLSHGADPNGAYVMHYGVISGTPDILHLLISAGGDVNRGSRGLPCVFALFAPLSSVDVRANARVLLAEPSLCLVTRFGNKTIAQEARKCLLPGLADVIADEVRSFLNVHFWFLPLRARQVA